MSVQKLNQPSSMICRNGSIIQVGNSLRKGEVQPSETFPIKNVFKCKYR